MLCIYFLQRGGDISRDNGFANICFIKCMAWSSKWEGKDTEFKNRLKHFRSAHVSKDLPQVSNWCWLEVRCGLCVASFQLLFTLFQNLARFSSLNLCINSCMYFKNVFCVSCVIYLSTPGLNESFVMKIAPMGIQPFFCSQIACEQIAEASNRFIIQNYWQFFMWVINGICKLFANISLKLLYIPWSAG